MLRGSAYEALLFFCKKEEFCFFLKKLFLDVKKAIIKGKLCMTHLFMNVSLRGKHCKIKKAIVKGDMILCVDLQVL